MDRCSIRDDPNLTSRPIIRFTWGINANRDVRSPSQRSRGLKSNRKSPDANKNGDSFHPPPLRRAMVSILCLRLVFPPTNGKIRRRSSVTEFRSVKNEILLYITTGLKKKLKKGKKKERRKIVDSKRRNIISIMYKSKSNRTV